MYIRIRFVQNKNKKTVLIFSFTIFFKKLICQYDVNMIIIINNNNMILCISVLYEFTPMYRTNHISFKVSKSNYFTVKRKTNNTTTIIVIILIKLPLNIVNIPLMVINEFNET